MKYGDFEVKDTFIAAIAFLLVMINQPIGILLVLGFAFFASSSLGVVKNSLMALFLNILFAVLGILSGYFFLGASELFMLIPATSAFGSLLASMGSVIKAILNFLMFLLGAYGFIFAILGKNIIMPGISGLADKALGIEKSN